MIRSLRRHAWVLLLILPALVWLPARPASAHEVTPEHVRAVRDPAAATRAAGDAGGIAWRPCPITALPERKCGELAVPLSHHEPQGTTIAAQGDFAGLVDIGGGRRMYLACRGQGSPTVVLESGYGNDSDGWSIDAPEVPQPQVLPGVAGFTRVCAYDRPGTVGLDRSRSDPVPQPRTAPAVVADLHALLQAAGVPGPYVLAGHSLGGMFVRLYAHTYPEEVVGLVFIDARPDGLYEQIERRLTPEQWRAMSTFLLVPVVPEGSPNDPFASARSSGLEYYDTTPFNDLLREAARTTPLRPMPLAVLASGRQWPGTAADFLGVPPEVLFATWRVGQEVLATILPHARFFVASESGHDIYIDQPALVTEAIRQVVAGVRDPDTWVDLVACCTP